VLVELKRKRNLLCNGLCVCLEWYIVGLRPGWVKAKTIKLLFAASPRHLAQRSESKDWLALKRDNVSRVEQKSMGKIVFQ
jgi:hypothetical protein